MCGGHLSRWLCTWLCRRALGWEGVGGQSTNSYQAFSSATHSQAPQPQHQACGMLNLVACPQAEANAHAHQLKRAQERLDQTLAQVSELQQSLGTALARGAASSEAANSESRRLREQVVAAEARCDELSAQLSAAADRCEQLEARGAAATRDAAAAKAREEETRAELERARHEWQRIAPQLEAATRQVRINSCVFPRGISPHWTIFLSCRRSSPTSPVKAH